ncbi:hypothetical protein TWF225_001706 [Orbilia oligospora]|nr:hypothetical protein TWF225_001706 [Orbilia oligospora]KAF3233840.1 hypothetical protein TWF128_002868 [Orbilia oligospora]KAF3250558.1 hypothetical protein TWF217_008595 [Orbilia oligospora]KAF3279937.1 hypothetical protein TWF132_011960 [Orbilia oligospora]
MANKRKKKSDNSGDEGDKSDASERRGRRTRWWSLRSRSGPGGSSEAELGEGRPRPRLRSPPPPQPEEHNTQQQHAEKEEDSDDDEDDPNIDPTTATNTISNTNIPTTAPPPPPPPPATTATTRSKSASQLPPSDIYSHSLIAPPRPRQTVNRKFWDIIHRRQTSKRTSRSAPPHTANDHEDPEYRSFDAAKAVRPPPRIVDYLPKPSERAAKFGTPPSILKESSGPRRFDFPLPAPTEAERNWRHTISRIPGAVAGAVLRERASVDFDKKSRVHGYFQSDPIYLTENTTPERRPSPPPVEHSLSEYLDSLVHSDQAKAKSNKDDNNNNKDNQNPQLNYSSLFDEFQGEKLPPAATGTPRRRRSVVFVEPEVPLNRNRRSLRPRPSSGPATAATAATAATTALAQIKAQQQQASSSSRGNPGPSSSSSSNKKSKPSKKGSKDKKGPKNGGDENKP